MSAETSPVNAPCDVTETAWAPYLMRKCSDSTIT